MNDFLLEYKSIFTFFIELLSAFTGVFLYKKYKLKTTKYFIWFLVYLFICDSFNRYVYYIENDGILSFLEDTKLVKNYWWTTLYWKIGAILFFVFYYNKILQKIVFKNIIKLSGIAYVIFSGIYIAIHWQEYFTRFFPIISILGAIIIFLCAVFYFIEILLSDSILTFYKELNFYISSAIFIWWLIITPLIFYDVYFAYEIGNPKRDWDFIFLKWQIYLFANMFMYLTFTFALICCKPQNN